MDHIVYLGSAKELHQVSAGEKTMLAMASMGKKRPYGKVSADDTLFFVNGRTPSKVKAMARVKSALSAELEGDMAKSVRRHRDALLPANVEDILDKRYVVLIEFEGARSIVPFSVADSVHGGPGDWVVVEDIDEVTG